jgi:hypothetical protein
MTFKEIHCSFAEFIAVINMFAFWSANIITADSFKIVGILKTNANQVTEELTPAKLIRESRTTDRILVEVLRKLFIIPMCPFRWGNLVDSLGLKSFVKRDELIHLLCTKKFRELTIGGANWNIRTLLLSFHFPTVPNRAIISAIVYGKPKHIDKQVDPPLKKQKT